jgi:TolB-like protein
MFTDIVGYTSLTQKDEALSMQLLEEHRRLVRPFFPRHNGKEVKTIGDAFLVEFASALEAVRCAFDIQQSMHEMNNGRLPEKQVQLRIGVHVGDVIHSQNDVYGDAVNVANRMFPLAMPGGICVSEQVYDHVKNKFEFPLVSIGRRELKNLGEPMEVFKVVMPWEQSAAVETPAYGTNRIAILPFRNMSPDPNDEFFAEGMTEEIISTVSGISGLDVISRTSVMGYKGTVKKVGDIGKELKVGSVLEGSFRKSGNRIRVTTQLIEVARDRHLWAQNYDRNLDDVFEVQSDVAKQVAEALRVRILSPERERIERKPTDSTTAYTLYLKGRYLWNKRGLDDLKQACDCFELAVKEDPNFALGYVGVADCCVLLRHNWGIDMDSNLERAKGMLSKALELDPALAEAHTTKGYMLEQEYNIRQAEEEFRKAIELKPSYATAHQWYHAVLLDELRWDEAQVQIEKAVELDPLSPIINNNYGGFYYEKKAYGKALEFYRRSVELGFVGGHGNMAVAYGKLKMLDDEKREASVWVEHVQGTYPFARAEVDAVHAWLSDDRQTLRELLPEIEAHVQETFLNCDGIANLHFYLGEVDKGFEWLERAYSAKLPGLMGIQHNEYLDGVRTDPRYLDLLKRLGLDQTPKSG